MSTCEEEDYGPGLDSLYDSVCVVKIHKSSVRAPAVVSLSEKLAPICSSFLHLDRVKELDREGELKGILDLITDPKCFYSAFRPGSLDLIFSNPSVFSSSISRNMAHHLDRLLEYGVVKRVSARQTVVLHAFTVPKKSAGVRFVADGRKLNKLMYRPPEMLLPKIPQVIDRVLESSWAVLADGKSWFYQFGLHEEIQAFFGINLGHQRGDFIQTRLIAMCMGWSFAPCIAHRTARVLLPDDSGVTWVDNFIVLDKSREAVTFSFSQFLARCKHVNAVLNLEDEFYGEPLQVFCALGIEFDLVNHRFRAEHKWVTKLLNCEEWEKVKSNSCTIRQFFKVFGSLVWNSYSVRSPLCYLPSSLSFIRDVARTTTQSPEAWDLPLDVRSSTLAELSLRMSEVEVNNWQGKRPTQEVTVWSDASQEGWAAVFEGEKETVAQGLFTENPEWHIYIKEIFAAAKAIQLTASMFNNKKVLLMVDNMAAVYSIQRGHSSNFISNTLLAKLFRIAEEANLYIVCTWVSTLVQKADPFSRDSKAKDPILLDEL